jgi:hypothetical protein
MLMGFREQQEPTDHAPHSRAVRFRFLMFGECVEGYEK